MQEQLRRLYALDHQPSVAAFVRPIEGDGRQVRRERVLVREADDSIELAVELPRETLQAPQELDSLCQLFEGVSHFVLLAERARCDLHTTQLELELQAEIDKYLLLAFDAAPAVRAKLKSRLFDNARFIDPPGSERGERYRRAHRLARKFIDRIERHYWRLARREALIAELRRFYRTSPASKIAFAQAA